MPTPPPNAHQALCDEILAEAQRQREQLLRTARQESEALLAKARQEAAKARQQTLAQAQAEAGRRRERILATVPLEISRLRSVRIERLLQSVYEQARQRLQAARGEGHDYRETLIGLAVEAIGRMHGQAFVVKLSPPDYRAAAQDLAKEIARRLADALPRAITLSEEPSLTEPGLLIEDEEGRQVWDNRLSARLERMWPELRQQIAFGASLVTESGSAGGNT